MRNILFLLLMSFSAWSQNDCILPLTLPSGASIAVGVGDIRYMYEEGGSAVLVQSNKLDRYKVQEDLDSVNALSSGAFFEITDRVTNASKLINKRFVQSIVVTSGNKALVTMDVGGFTSTESFTTIKGRADDCSSGSSDGNGIFSSANASATIPNNMAPSISSDGVFLIAFDGGNPSFTIDDSGESITLQAKQGETNFIVAPVMSATINNGGYFLIDDNRTGGNDAGAQYTSNPTSMTPTSLVPKAYVDALSLTQIKGTGTAPSIAVGVSAGTSASASVTSAESSNSAGRFTLTSGSGSVAVGTWVTVTFANAYTVIPVVQLFADRTKSDVGGNNASLLLGDYQVSVSVSTTAFSMYVNADPSALANSRFDFNYITIGGK